MSTCDKRILGVYLGVLHRYPDRGGYYFHQRKWCSGGSLGNLDQMIDYFMSSTEYKVNFPVSLIIIILFSLHGQDSSNFLSIFFLNFQWCLHTNFARKSRESFN